MREQTRNEKSSSSPNPRSGTPDFIPINSDEPPRETRYNPSRRDDNYRVSVHSNNNNSNHNNNYHLKQYNYDDKNNNNNGGYTGSSYRDKPTTDTYHNRSSSYRNNTRYHNTNPYPLSPNNNNNNSNFSTNNNRGEYRSIDRKKRERRDDFRQVGEFNANLAKRNPKVKFETKHNEGFEVNKLEVTLSRSLLAERGNKVFNNALHDEKEMVAFLDSFAGKLLFKVIPNGYSKPSEYRNVLQNGAIQGAKAPIILLSDWFVSIIITDFRGNI